MRPAARPTRPAVLAAPAAGQCHRLAVSAAASVSGSEWPRRGRNPRDAPHPHRVPSAAHPIARQLPGGAGKAPRAGSDSRWRLSYPLRRRPRPCAAESPSQAAPRTGRAHAWLGWGAAESLPPAGRRRDARRARASSRVPRALPLASLPLTHNPYLAPSRSFSLPMRTQSSSLSSLSRPPTPLRPDSDPLAHPSPFDTRMAAVPNGSRTKWGGSLQALCIETSFYYKSMSTSSGF